MREKLELFWLWFKERKVYRFLIGIGVLLLIFIIFLILRQKKAPITPPKIEETFLVKLEYKDQIDHGKILANSQVRIAFLEGDFLTFEGLLKLTPTFVGVLSTSQLSLLKKEGLGPIILEKNPQLESYFLLFHPKPNQGETIQDLGEYFIITPHHVLLKTTPDKMEEALGRGFLISSQRLETPSPTLPPKEESLLKKGASPLANFFLSFFKWSPRTIKFEGYTPTIFPTSTPVKPTPTPLFSPTPTVTITLVPGTPTPTLSPLTPTPTPTTTTNIVDNLVNQVSQDKIGEYINNLVDNDTRHSCTDGNRIEADYIASHFRNVGLKEGLWGDFFQNFSVSCGQTRNVGAELTGKQDTKTFILVGHFDSIAAERNNAPGADDNGSGTAIVMEAARVLSNASFAYTIKFLTVSGEEQGLVGSSAFVQKVSQVGEDIGAVINVDMVGYGPGQDCVWAFYNNSSSEEIARLIFNQSQKYNPNLQISSSQSSNQSSDHASFWAAGISSAGVYECQFNPNYHSANDLPSYVNTSQLAALTRAVVAALATLAEPVQ